jgi:xanthine dehydrogenase small subunit
MEYYRERKFGCAANPFLVGCDKPHGRVANGDSGARTAHVCRIILPMTQSEIHFFHLGEMVCVRDAPMTRSVLDWLREDARCVGTKEGCKEGDCGACTVVIGTPQPDGTLDLKPVNSCIQFLPTLHGKALITVEELAQNNKLHPCQQAMVDCHASQCGFCTPGFVMTLFAHYETQLRAGKGAASRAEIDDVLSGNLCRCTGYRPIIEAAQKMFSAPQVRFEDNKILQALRGSGLPAVGSAKFISPTARAEFAEYYATHPTARILAGSTDVGLWVNKQFRAQDHLLYIGNVEDLRFASIEDGILRIGAAVNLETAFAAISKHILPGNESFREWWIRFASPLIRNAGTLAGNVANGSPIGDSMPVLMALGAKVVLQRGSALRELALVDLYLGYMKNAMQPGEFVAEILIPAAQYGHFRTYKISKRFDQDISAVCFAGSIVLQGERIAEVKLAYGGMAATPARAVRAEAVLRGKAWDEVNVDLAMAALAEDFAPLTDMRATKEYRAATARNLLQKFWLETRANDAIPSAQLSVRHVESAL